MKEGVCVCCDELVFESQLKKIKTSETRITSVMTEVLQPNGQCDELRKLYSLIDAYPQCQNIPEAWDGLLLSPKGVEFVDEIPKMK